mgnify:FL=1
MQKRPGTDLTIVTSSIAQVNQKLPEIMERYQVIATTGIAQPNIPVPFITLEQFIDADIDQLLDQLLIEDELLDLDQKQLEQNVDEDDTRQLCIQFLERNVTFINPKKVIDLLWNFADKVIEQWQFTDELKGFRINFILHCGNMLERNVLHRTLTPPDGYQGKLYGNAAYEQLHLATQSLARALNIDILPVEEYYLLELIENHRARVQSK